VYTSAVSATSVYTSAVSATGVHNSAVSATGLYTSAVSATGLYTSAVSGREWYRGNADDNHDELAVHAVGQQLDAWTPRGGSVLIEQV